MSASLIWGVTWGVEVSVRVMNPPDVVTEPELEIAATDVDELVWLLWPAAPPLIQEPTAPLIAATTPSVGATSVAAARLFSASWSAWRWLATWAPADSISGSVGGAVVWL